MSSAPPSLSVGNLIEILPGTTEEDPKKIQFAKELNIFKSFSPLFIYCSCFWLVSWYSFSVLTFQMIDLSVSPQIALTASIEVIIE